ncbi:MAG: hypothetical protein Kow00109_06610 [Acidobacteriota bacterium]
MAERPWIEPEMKVAELLQHFPELEDTLLELSPAFAKLKNPVLRRTVAKATSLAQAARVAGIPVGQLIRTLRCAAGQSAAPGGEADAAAPDDPGTRPEWARSHRAKGTLDAGRLLDQGEKPVVRVMQELKQLAPGEVYLVRAPFLPAPLIDLARNAGVEAWWEETEGGEILVYFHTPGDVVGLE